MASVGTGPARRAPPRMAEYDFAAARRSAATAWSTGFARAGATPAGTDAVINADLAQQARRRRRRSGGRVRLRRPVATASPPGRYPNSAWPDRAGIFVAPGTIDRLAAATTATGRDNRTPRCWCPTVAVSSPARRPRSRSTGELTDGCRTAGCPGRDHETRRAGDARAQRRFDRPAVHGDRHVQRAGRRAVAGEPVRHAGRGAQDRARHVAGGRPSPQPSDARLRAGGRVLRRSSRRSSERRRASASARRSSS